MEREVAESVLKATTKCPHGFVCLHDEHCDRPRCEVDYANGPNVLFLKDKAHAICPYRSSFGACQVCQCPIHYDVYTGNSD